MKSDIEITREYELAPIASIAAKLGVPEEALQPYGQVIAKIDAANTRIRQVEVYVGPLVSLGSRVTACEASISEMRPAFEKTRDAWTRFRGAVFVIAGIAIALGWLASFARDLVTVKLGLK